LCAPKENPVIYEDLRNKYIDSGQIDILLKNTEITILNEFLDNWESIKAFNNEFYGENLPKTVLCGINPGKNGAGKTGLPFIDFTSLSKLLNNVNRQDTERSAQFFYDVVQELGVDDFYKTFYVTNISWVGYIKGNKNLNYYDLPLLAKKFVYEMFMHEMNIVSPTTIISLSGAVKGTVDELFNDSSVETNLQLPHPNYCAFPRNYKSCKAQYIDLLSQYIKK
jgi:hypothetical protein